MIIALRIRAEYRKFETVLPFRLAVTSGTIATQPAQQRLHIIHEIHCRHCRIDCQQP